MRFLENLMNSQFLHQKIPRRPHSGWLVIRDRVEMVNSATSDMRPAFAIASAMVRPKSSCGAGIGWVLRRTEGWGFAGRSSDRCLGHLGADVEQDPALRVTWAEDDASGEKTLRIARRPGPLPPGMARLPGGPAIPA